MWKVNNKISGVYEIKNILNNHRYVGSSININYRFNQHLYYLNKGNHHSAILQRAWNKYGEDKFEFNILEICEPIKDTLLFIEQKYLDLNPEYNICRQAYSLLGFKFSEESKLKMSKRFSGKNNPRFGVKYSKELKCILSELAKLRKPSSIEHMNNMTALWINSKIYKDRKVPVVAINASTGEELEFGSLCEAGIFLGNRDKRNNIRLYIKNNLGPIYGYIWKLKIA